MGRTVYSPTFISLIFMVNVGEYTSPIDPMGTNIAGWNITIFNRKYIHLHSGAPIFQPAMLDDPRV